MPGGLCRHAVVRGGRTVVSTTAMRTYDSIQGLSMLPSADLVTLGTQTSRVRTSLNTDDQASDFGLQGRFQFREESWKGAFLESEARSLNPVFYSHAQTGTARILL